MPLTLPATRRHFLHTAGSAALATLCKAQPTDPSELWHLLADTHIASDTSAVSRGINMAEHLKSVTTHVLEAQQQEKAFGLLINGDLALRQGEAADYATLVQLLTPLREAGVDVHLTLGNHDHRENFHTACAEALSLRRSPLDHHHTGVITSAVVNWVLLETLEEVDHTPGLVGEAQLQWLERTLADLPPTKPTLVFAHHNPQSTAPEGKKISGLKDTDALLKVLEAHPQVKAYFFGHTHRWEIETRPSGLHLINLPPVAYIFNTARPSGYVQARLTPTGMELKLHSLDPAHPEHAQVKKLQWS
jgi:3',5'-cyclic-AMP phosphodiesterase